MWIKICGIKDIETAIRVADCGPDAIGLNFYAATPRFVQPETAREIVRALQPAITPVGLFVNHAVADVMAICERTGIRVVQIHGDESPDWLSELHDANPDLRIIRAFRVGNAGFAEVADYLQECRDRAIPLWACLVDARSESQYGGTGERAPWDLVTSQYDDDNWPPFILAGGLNADNVAEAMMTVHPWGVDVASGVESATAVKEIAAVKQFITKARNPKGFS